MQVPFPQDTSGEPYDSGYFAEKFPTWNKHVIRIGNHEDDLLNRNSSIYRVIAVKWLVELFDQGKLTLADPKEVWKDPFESPLHDLSFVAGDDQMSVKPFFEEVYGQCWTQRSETDYMWDYYGKPGMSVIIESTPSRLLGVLNDAIPLSIKSGNHERDICFVGAVEYLEEEHLRDRFTSRGCLVSEFAGTGRQGPVNILLLKRTKYEYEKEVRLVYWSHEGEEAHDVEVTPGGGGRLLKIPVDPHKLVRSITLHPEMDDWIVKAVEERIKGTGFEGDINKSTLLNEPDFSAVEVESIPNSFRERIKLF